MKKLLVLFAGLFVLAITAQNLSAQNEVTATADASATIIAPLSIEKEIDLSFGDIVKSTTGGTVVIATNNDRSFTGGLSTFGALLGNPTAAKFNVLGEAGAKYSVQLPTADVTLTKTGSGATMTIAHETFKHDAGNNPKIKANESFRVGATLNVAADQTAGEYTGTFDVTIAYE